MKQNLTDPLIVVGNAKFLNVPMAFPLVNEIVAEDCYRLEDIPKESIVLDIGAFYGEFGLLCRMNRQCCVMAYEPSRINFDIATLNAAINQQTIDSDFHLKHAAIAGKSCSATLFHRQHHPAGSALVDYGDGTPEAVDCLRLGDELDRAVALFGDRLICVKMDCEGSEVDIFNSDEKWMDRVSFVTMEWHNYDGEKYAKQLQAHGFDVQLTGTGPKPTPVYVASMGGGMLFARRQK